MKHLTINHLRYIGIYSFIIIIWYKILGFPDGNQITPALMTTLCFIFVMIFFNLKFFTKLWEKWHE